jgi:adenine deaminase
MDLPTLLAVARGDSPADLVFTNGRVINVFSGEIESTDIAVAGGRIVGLGSGYTGREMIDLGGAYVSPGLIDAHVHIESSLCLPAEFARAVVPRGVTTVVADPHEIANVAGVPGIRFMRDASRGLPLRVILMAPSCVPATTMATSGATLTVDDLAPLLAGDDPTVHGLAEVMNFPGVIGGDAAVLAKLAHFAGRPIDGHAPAVLGKPLNAYVLAGVGSDHECVNVDEAREKLSRGLYLLIREATNAHNLQALLPVVTPANSRRICFCTDDRQPADLLAQGSIDYMLREAIAFGIRPMDAFRMATLNPAEWFGLTDRGAIAPGRVADFFVFDDLQSPLAERVFVAGKEVATKLAMTVGDHAASAGDHAALAADHAVPAADRATPAGDRAAPAGASAIGSAVHLRVDAAAFKIPATGQRIRVIGSLPDQLFTDHQIIAASIENGLAVADPGRDILKMAVIERHHGTGKIGLGFIHGIGLKRGAIAGTVAHDHHNLVVIGVDDASMAAAANAVDAMGGGLAAVDGDRVLATLPLPVAGLMSDRPIEQVRDAYRDLLGAGIDLGSELHDPFMAMSFMALEVIPKLKLTDQGLVDVERFAPVDLFVS